MVLVRKWNIAMMTITKYWMYSALVMITTAGIEDLRPRLDCVGSHSDHLLVLRGPPEIVNNIHSAVMMPR